MSAHWIDENSVVRSEVISEDEAMIQIGDQKYVLSFEAVYDLAFRFAHLVNEMSTREERECTLQ